MEKKKDTRGGARPGSGRKPLDYERIAITIHLRPELRDKLNALCMESGKSKSIVIGELINEKREG